MSELTQHLKMHDKVGLPAKLASATKQKNTLIVIGDSWAALEIAADGISTSSRGVAFNTNMHLKNYFEITDIKGGSGERLDEIAARFSADVVANNPGYCMINGGVNDLTADRTSAQMFASMKSMIDSAISAGITPIVLPCNFGIAAWASAGSQAATEARVDTWGEYNTLLLNYSFSNPGWIYVSSAYNGIMDHEYSDGVYSVHAPALLDSCVIQINGVVDDSNHLGSGGAYRVGKAIAAQLSLIFPAADTLPHHYADRGAGGWNCMQKQSNTPSSIGLATDADITNLPAEGWMARLRNNDVAAQGTITASARSDIEGGFFTTVACVDMDKAGIMELRESDPTEFGYTANKHLFSDYGIAVGDTVIFTFEIKVHTVSGDGDINGIDGIATIYDSSNSAVDTLTVNKNAGSTTENYITSDFEDTILILSSLPYVIPATASYWFVYTEVHISNSSGVTGLTSYTKELGRIGIRKIA